jgi:hypothetical protein
MASHPTGPAMSGPEQLDTRYRIRETQLDGERVAVLDIEIPDDAPAEIKEGLARRQVVNEGGTCPCGARMILPNRAARRRAARTGQPIAVDVEHERNCPALLRGWQLFDPDLFDPDQRSA